MPETKNKSFAEEFLKNTVRGDADSERSFTAERQLTAQAFNLHVEYRDGRRSEGFAWSHYGGNTGATTEATKRSSSCLARGRSRSRATILASS